MRQNQTWMQKWNIYLNACPTNLKELKNFVMEKFRKRVWGKELGRKKKYYVQEFNPACDLQQKEYIGDNIPWREKNLIAQLRTNSHQLQCKTSKWKRPKDAWKERVCTFFTSGAMESEKHFILECDVFKDIKESYENMLASVSWHCLFSEGIVGRLVQLIINLNRKRVELQRAKNRELMVS